MKSKYFYSKVLLFFWIKLAASAGVPILFWFGFFSLGGSLTYILAAEAHGTFEINKILYLWYL